MKNYGEKITGYRKKVGLLQAELAEKLGVTRQAVSRWEHDVTEPDLESVKRMCRIFGITTDEFLFGEFVEYKDLRAASTLGNDDENALTETAQNGEEVPDDEEVEEAEEVEEKEEAEEAEEIAAAESNDGNGKTQKKKFTLFKTKRAKNIFKLAFNCSVAVILIVAAFVGTSVMYLFENQINSQLSPTIIDDEEVSISSAEGQKLSARIMEEGATLLQNNNGVLPLDRSTDTKVNVFGWRSIDWIYGSEGANASGGVSPENNNINENVDFYKALKGYGIKYNDALRQMYFDFRQPDVQSQNLKGKHINDLYPLCEPDIDDKKYYTDELLENAKNYSDTAFVVIARMAGEAMTPSKSEQKKKIGETDTTRHYFEISKEEEKLLEYVGKNYEKVIVLLNVANAFELGFLETIDGLDACVYLGFTGTRAVSALPKLLWGEVSFSGHTVDTFSYDMFTNPANVFGGQTYTDIPNDYNGTWGPWYVDYVEGIYLGYRWYETADKEGIWNDYERDIPAGKLKGYEAVVQYPFGYGLSYNDYTWTVGDISIVPGSEIDDKTVIDIPVKVKNNGKIPGREVVAAYVTVPYTPGGIEKSYVSLVAFTKTEIIDPGMETEVTLTINVSDFRSYDCYDKNGNGFKGYEIEKGEYKVKLMTDSHTVKKVDYKGAEQDAAFSYSVKETIKIPADPVTGQTVKNLFTGEDAIDTVPIDSDTADFTTTTPWLTRENFMKPSEFAANNKGRKANPGAYVADNGTFTKADSDAYDNATVDEFGESIDNTSVTWGAKNGKMLTTQGGELTETAKKLGEDYNAPEWKEVLDQLSVDDVLLLVNQYYGTKEVSSIGKPEIKDYDGPAQIGGFVALPTRGTGYPTMVVVASTWNPKLAYEFGKSYGKDMNGIGVYGVWGWSIDTHRTAFCGRNHEAPSEDPMLAGTIVAQAVKGLNTRGRYSFIKHFALFGRDSQNKWMSEQALREIHLEAFRKAFVEGGALGCMTTYHGIGAEHTNSSVALLQGVLRKEWNFNGAITTDYLSVKLSYLFDSLVRCGGDLGMGVSLGTVSGVTYTEKSSPRLQHRMKEMAKHVLYTWLRAAYNEREYLKNPDDGDTYSSVTAINSWVWWKPLITCIDIIVVSGCLLWITFTVTGVFMKDENSSQQELLTTEQTENN